MVANSHNKTSKAVAAPKKAARSVAVKAKKPAAAASSDNGGCVVCNVKVKYIRPHYNNLKSWMEDEDKNVYIGRRGVVFVDKVRFPKQDSIWANPYKITKTVSREDVLRQYEQHLRDKLKKDPSLKEKLLELDGKRLGCWCHPQGCHGDILLRAMREIKAGTGDW